MRTALVLRAATHARDLAAAAVTVIGVITAIILFTSELREQLTPYVVQQVRCGLPPLASQTVCLLLGPLTCAAAQMSVDVSRQQFIRVNFNITFPSLPCHGARPPWGAAKGAERCAHMPAPSGRLRASSLSRQGVCEHQGHARWRRAGSWAAYVSLRGVQTLPVRAGMSDLVPLPARLLSKRCTGASCRCALPRAHSRSELQF